MQHFYSTIRFVFFSLFFFAAITGKSQVILTKTTNANYPNGVAVDKAGNIYFTDQNDEIIEMISPAGVIDTIAGIIDSVGLTGNGGPATTAALNYPIGIALDDSNNIYIADNGNNSIRKIYKKTGIIVSITGVTGGSGYGGDNGPATSSSVLLNGPTGIAVDAAGNVYFSDANNYIVREINKTTGIITTVAGTPQSNGNYAAAGLATVNSLALPEGISLDKLNNLYIADNELNGVFKVNFTTDSMTYIVGSLFSQIYNSPPTLSTDINMYGLENVVADSLGNVFISNPYTNYIYKVNKNDSIFTYAGTGSAGYSGDNVMANTASINNPAGMVIDDSLNLFFADAGNNSIREIRVAGPNIISQPPANPSVCWALGTTLAIGVQNGTGATYQWTVDSSLGNGPELITNDAQYSGATTDSLHIKSITTFSLVYQCSINNGYITSNQSYIDVVPSYSVPYVSVKSSADGDSTCPGEAVTLNASSYAPKPYIPVYGSYYWNNGDSSSTITVNPTKTTQYIVTYYASCPEPDTITVYVSTNPIRAHVFPSGPVCNGSTITLYGSGGSGAYGWSDTTGVTIINNEGIELSKSGKYVVAGIDMNGCEDTASVNIQVLPSPILTIAATPKDTLCVGTAITLHATGALTYSWSGGVFDNIAFSPNSSSIYNVMGTDINGCTGTASVPVVVNPLPVVTASASPDLVCAGSSAVLSGNGGVSYAWSSGVSNNVPFVPVNSGSYTVTATSLLGCTNTAVVALTVDPKPVITASAFPSATLCQGSSLALFGAGGASYAWSGGVNNGVSFTPSASATYTITGIDANGCTNSDTINVTVHNKVVPTVSSVNTSCGLKNGSASVVASNGVPPYTYSWSTVPASSTASIDSLAAGTYVVSVSDSANCASSTAVAIASSTAPILSVASTNSNCGSVGTGSASVSVSGGTAPYHFIWNNGDTLTNDYNLKAGTYIITVKDVNGCSTFAPAIVSNDNGPKITVLSLVNVRCFGDASGSIAVSVSGGTGPYQYTWSNGASTASIGSLFAGPYQLTVMDVDSCISVQTFAVSQPKAQLALVASTVKADCGIADGSASVAVSGGSMPYLYKWSNGVSTAVDASVNAGVYGVIVTDDLGCIDSSVVAVSDKTGPTLVLSLKSNATCGAGGLISVLASGPNAPFSYLWSNGASATSVSNVPAGLYDVTVTDAHGCVSSADTTVAEVLPQVLPICMVTVDPIGGRHNFIIWNKTADKEIASYNVYKESTTAGVYFKIASIPSIDSTKFIDTLSDATVRSWRYELSQVDSCGNESALSPDHKTMHLTVNQGLGNNVNLIWDNYEGLAFNTYYVYRDTVSTSFTVIDSIPNNIFTYTDNSPLITKKPLLYRIGISNPGGCNPGARAEGINYNASKSNTGNLLFNPGASGVTAVNGLASSLVVFPNPATGLVTFALQLGKDGHELNLDVVNTLGQVVASHTYEAASGSFSKQIDLSSLAKGVYFFKITSNNYTSYSKVVLQ